MLVLLLPLRIKLVLVRKDNIETFFIKINGFTLDLRKAMKNKSPVRFKNNYKNNYTKRISWPQILHYFYFKKIKLNLAIGNLDASLTGFLCGLYWFAGSILHGSIKQRIETLHQTDFVFNVVPIYNKNIFYIQFEADFYIIIGHLLVLLTRYFFLTTKTGGDNLERKQSDTRYDENSYGKPH